MVSSAFNIFEVYKLYCDVFSSDSHAYLRDKLKMLSKSLESIEHAKEDIIGNISKLMSTLNMSVDSSQFNCFYGFVYFICRENGQKSISVNKAIAAWKVVLNGRFRLLNQWCTFLVENHKHNITEDIWNQILVFSRCVNENLEGYNPEEAWPVLIDDFVDHMYKVRKSNKCYGFEDNEFPGITDIFAGLNLQAGCKRKCITDSNMHCQTTPASSFNMNFINLEQLKKTKRARYYFSRKNIGCSKVFSKIDPVVYQEDVNLQNSFGYLQISPPPPSQ